MDTPYTIQLEAFEGPLDLLLRLIERQELDITVISLARVADQYLAYVRALPAPEPRALAEFIALAARLVLIKSRVLLPSPGLPGSDRADDGDDGEALARQLREYQRFKQAASRLRAWEEEGRRSYLRLAPPAVLLAPHDAPQTHTITELVAAVQRRLQLILPLEPPAVPLPAPKILTVTDVARTIRRALARQPSLLFEDLLQPLTSRTEIIVTLWAVLELLKRHAITVEQPALFGPIIIAPGPAYASNMPYTTE